MYAVAHCAALAMEIDGTESAEKILRLLRCNRWRSKAESALSGEQGGKPTVDGLQKLLQEAEKHGIAAATDVVGSKLLAALEATQAWQDKAKEVVTEIKVSSYNS
jgi:hypothetical protein